MLKLHKTHKSSVDQDSMAFCQNMKILRHTLILFTAHQCATAHNLENPDLVELYHKPGYNCI